RYPSFIDTLRDVTNPLTQCVRRLRVRLVDILHRFGEIAVENSFQAVQELLEVNQELEYLDVIAYSEYHDDIYDFRRHHQPIYKARAPLSMSCKVAFLSVMKPSASPSEAKRTRKSKHQICALNEHLLAAIFAFAAPPVMREVYFRKADEDDWIDDDQDLPI
ncbi:hypothetical protein L915_17979, partial [Phytophthora nicotianae]